MENPRLGQNTREQSISLYLFPLRSLRLCGFFFGNLLTVTEVIIRSNYNRKPNKKCSQKYR